MPTGSSFSPQSISDLKTAITAREYYFTPSEERLLRTMLEHPVATSLASAWGNCQRAEVSPATMTRVVRKLGFLKFSQLREIFRDYVRYQLIEEDTQEAGTPPN